MSKFLRHCVLLAIFCAGSFSAVPSFADDTEKQVLRFGFKSSFPMSYMENGKPVGQLIDVAHSALAATGRPFTSQAYPLRRMLKLLEEGYLDVGITIRASSVTPGTALIGASPLLILHLRLYCSCTEPPPSIWDLGTEKLGIVGHYTYAGLIEELKTKRPGVRITPAGSQLKAIQLLKAGRVEYVLTYERDATFTFNQLKMSSIRKTSVKEIPLVFLVSKKTNNPAGLLSKLEKASRAYKRSVREGQAPKVDEKTPAKDTPGQHYR